MKFTFEIKEISYGSVEVEADNYTKAKELAEAEYHKGNAFWGSGEYEIKPIEAE